MQLEKEYPDEVLPESPTQRVGSEPIGSFNQVEHSKPMLSLENAFIDDELDSFDKRIGDKIGTTEPIVYVSEPKIDGREIALDGDIIISIDEKTVRKISDILVHLQREKSVGDEMVLTVNRNGEIMELTMILEERPR